MTRAIGPLDAGNAEDLGTELGRLTFGGTTSWPRTRSCMTGKRGRCG
ncbi:MAG TPA: hypothetical protein VFW50_08310 [Streptosporangiaceae bacterium]|nr:hypothetical protein [Streptosporangiaceae bacterium]